MGEKQKVAFTSKRDVFRRLAELSKISNLTPAQRRSYEADIKAARDYLNELEYAREEGIEQGRRLGIEQGIEQGIERGAWNKLRSIVSNLRSKGMDNASIASLIDESPELIASI